MFSRFMFDHVLVLSFLLPKIFHCMGISHFIYSSVDRHLNSVSGCSFCVFFPLRYIPRIEIAKSYGNCMFYILKNCQAVFQSDWTILHSHQQCYEGSNFSTSSPTLVVFLMNTTILVGVKWHFIVVLIYISLIINKVQHFLTGHLLSL